MDTHEAGGPADLEERRGDGPEYRALVGSLYVRRDGGRRLAFHQQTPGGTP